MRNRPNRGGPPDIAALLRDLQSSDEERRGKALRARCPCRSGWQLFQEQIDLVERLKKEPSPTVRAHALHVLEDAAELQSEGYPTHPREATDEFLRKRRASRFPSDAEELRTIQLAKR